jgi:hypothetical protein
LDSIILTATISAPLLLLKLPILIPSLSNIYYYYKADRDNILKGFAKKSTLATGTERTEDIGIYTGEV